MQDDFENLSQSLIERKGTRTKRAIIAVVSVLLVVILAVTAALIVKTYVISSFIVEGTSMYPTLDGGSGAIQDSNAFNGEILYLNKLAKIKRGDIIVFTPDWIENSDGSYKSLVKRVIAVAGDHLQIIENAVYLNGDLINEPYVNEAMDGNQNSEWWINDGEIFVMGDNRNNSSDSRIYGPALLKSVVGKCFLIKGLDGKLRTP